MWQCFRVLFLPLLMTLPLASAANRFDFEGLVQARIVTTEYPGLLFSNAVVLSARTTLNELDFPPHSGSNVASDNGGPMTITFSTPVRSFSAYFTYRHSLTVQAFDALNHLVATATSRYSENEAISGVAGSSPNELIQVTAGAGISTIVITGDPAGASFVLDDVSVSTHSACDITQDDNANVLDVQAMINQALGIVPASNDLNQDGHVNVADVQIVINAALGLGCSAS